MTNKNPSLKANKKGILLSILRQAQNDKNGISKNFLDPESSSGWQKLGK